MLWNRFEQDRNKLDLYENPHFEPGSGICERNEIIRNVEKILHEMEGQPHTLIKAKALPYITQIPLKQADMLSLTANADILRISHRWVGVLQSLILQIQSVFQIIVLRTNFM